MGIRYYKPTSAGRRNASVSDFSELTDKNKKPEKSLTEPHKKTGGRNNQGFITAPPATGAAGERGCTGSLPSGATTRTAPPPRSPTSSTIRTARRGSP